MSSATPKRATTKVAHAALAGGTLGALGGAALGGAIPGVRARSGALLGALVMAVGEGATDAARQAGQLKPLPWRIAASAMPAAMLGWAAGRFAPSLPPPILGALTGGLSGAIGFRASKLALGAATGAAVGIAARRRVGPAAVAATATVAYRVTAAWTLRSDPQLPVVGERVPRERVPEVVPFAARQRYVGGGYVRDLADRLGGRFERNLHDVGIVASLDALAGPGFAPGRVHPLIREFYEHTSRFELTIVPEWRWWMRPPYWLFRTLVARPLGQANLPFNQREARRGMRSVIDTIDLDDSGEVDLRGWIRVFRDSEEPIYVGIYTTYRQDDTGYVSVGFPLPDANFTATLGPANLGEHDFALRSETGHAATGHYLSAVEGEDLTVLKLVPFSEEIEVHVRNGSLGADHRFSLGGATFLTLRYSMERSSGDARRS